MANPFFTQFNLQKESDHLLYKRHLLLQYKYQQIMTDVTSVLKKQKIERDMRFCLL